MIILKIRALPLLRGPKKRSNESNPGPVLRETSNRRPTIDASQDDRKRVDDTTTSGDCIPKQVLPLLTTIPHQQKRDRLKSSCLSAWLFSLGRGSDNKSWRREAVTPPTTDRRESLENTQTQEDVQRQAKAMAAAYDRVTW